MGELLCEANAKQEAALHRSGKAQQHCSLTDLEEFLLWKCIALWKHPSTQSFALGHTDFYGNARYLRCAFIKTSLRDKVFSSKKQRGICSNDDFHDTKAIPSFYSNSKNLEAEKFQVTWNTTLADIKQQPLMEQYCLLELLQPSWLEVVQYTGKCLWSAKFCHVGMLMRIWICLFQPE